MISDRELWACAATILKRHGGNAVEHAASRATELAKAGDEAGVKTWIAIADRIGRLESVSREGVAVN